MGIHQIGGYLNIEVLHMYSQTSSTLRTIPVYMCEYIFTYIYWSFIDKYISANINISANM